MTIPIEHRQTTMLREALRLLRRARECDRSCSQGAPRHGELDEAIVRTEGALRTARWLDGEQLRLEMRSPRATRDDVRKALAIVKGGAR